MRRAPHYLALACALACGGAASAEPLGTEGQLEVDGSATFDVQRMSLSGYDATTIFVAPAMTYFLRDHVSIGGTLSITYLTGGGRSETILGIGPTIGYVAPVGPQLALWPQVGANFQHANAGGLDSDSVTAHVFVPLVLQPVDHFFVGIGPFAETGILAKSEGADLPQASSFGVRSVVGGYF